MPRSAATSDMLTPLATQTPVIIVVTATPGPPTNMPIPSAATEHAVLATVPPPSVTPQSAPGPSSKASSPAVANAAAGQCQPPSFVLAYSNGPGLVGRCFDITALVGDNDTFDRALTLQRAGGYVNSDGVSTEGLYVVTCGLDQTALLARYTRGDTVRFTATLQPIPGHGPFRMALVNADPVPMLFKVRLAAK
jgi:hypothetical protein